MGAPAYFNFGLEQLLNSISNGYDASSCKSAKKSQWIQDWFSGSHFNPAGKTHGAPEDATRHAGDLGNIIVGDNGTATFTITDSHVSLAVGPNSIVGRAVVVHADPDHLGKGGHEFSASIENAGGRIACALDVS